MTTKGNGTAFELFESDIGAEADYGGPPPSAVFHAAQSVIKASGLTITGQVASYSVRQVGDMITIYLDDPELVSDEDETTAVLADAETMRLLREARAEKAAGRLLPDSEVRKIK
jgi:hypothetical protein